MSVWVVLGMNGRERKGVEIACAGTIEGEEILTILTECVAYQCGLSDDPQRAWLVKG